MLLPLRSFGKNCASVLLALLVFGCFAVAEPHLLPAPREAHFGPATPLPAQIAVSVPGHDAEDEFAARDLEAFLGSAAAKAAAPGAYRVELLRAASPTAKALLAREHLTFDAAMQDEGYVLVVKPRQATIIAASAAGVFYGVQSFKQWLPVTGEPRTIPTGTLRDWPAMRYRGLQDDLSRGPFPTLEFQKQQIRALAAYKSNLYSPYLEHTFQYPTQPLAAPPGSALTPAEAKELVAYARQYHVTIVPEQEAFGHLHHVLKYEQYKDVAEEPHGDVLAPAQPGSLPLIKDWFTTLAATFPSPFLHIGADETFDLGRGRTKPAVDERGYGPVYVDFLKQIHDELKPLNRKIVFWGDIGGDDPKAVAGLPKDMIAVPWNYWDQKNFAHLIEPFAKNGIETWVAPGVGNWNEVYPANQNALGNIQGFVREGQQLGSTGMLNTVWNDDGEGLFNLDWYGAVFGAVASWQPGESSIAAFEAGYGKNFHGDATGKVDEAQKEMMAALTALGHAHSGLNSDQLFWVDPWSEQGQIVSPKVLAVASEMRLHAERAIVLIAEARAANPALRHQDALTGIDLGARRVDLIGMKFQLADEMVANYTKALASQHDEKRRPTERLLEQIASMNGRMQDLRDGYSAIKGEYSQLWLAENRPYWLNNVTVRYDLAIELWQRRANLFADKTRDWGKDKPLPALAALEMPARAQ
jgi:hexosaminidase